MSMTEFTLPSERDPEIIRETFLYMTMRSLMIFIATECGLSREEAIESLKSQDQIWEGLGGQVVEGWDD